MSDYKWIHPPLKFVDEINPSDPLEISQDNLNQIGVVLYSFDIPEEDRKLYVEEFFTPEQLEEDHEAHEMGDDVEPVEYVVGFFISGPDNRYPGAGRNPLTDPQASDVFVHSLGLEREYPICYLPVGQHTEGWPQPGDYLISIEDYEAISRGIYTPATYTCEVVRTWDPHKTLRPRKETA